MTIPVRDGERFIAPAIESALRQDPRPLEVIVVDDGSTDQTGTVVAGFGDRVRFVSQAALGLEATRNCCVGEARGDLVAFLDSDDIWPEGRLAKLMAGLDATPGAQIVQGRLQRFSESDGRRVFVEEAQRAPSLCTALIRRTAFTTVGAFNTDLVSAGDVDWWLRAQELGIAVATIEEITLFYRRHEGNMTNDPLVDQRGMLDALRLSIRRRREAP